MKSSTAAQRIAKVNQNYNSNRYRLRKCQRSTIAFYLFYTDADPNVQQFLSTPVLHARLLGFSFIAGKIAAGPECSMCAILEFRSFSSANDLSPKYV